MNYNYKVIKIPGRIVLILGVILFTILAYPVWAFTDDADKFDKVTLNDKAETTYTGRFIMVREGNLIFWDQEDGLKNIKIAPAEKKIQIKSLFVHNEIKIEVHLKSLKN